MHVGLDELWHDRLVVVAAAAATLAVVTAPVVAGALSGVRLVQPENPEDALTDMGRVVLEDLHFAYPVGDTVIVPAENDPGIAWAGSVSRDDLAGSALPLGVRGLASYRYLPASDAAPEWAFVLKSSDRVVSDVGTIFAACTQFELIEDCSPSLLMQHDGEFYMLRSGLGSQDFLEPGAPMEAFAFPVLVHAQLGTLVLGAIRRQPEAKVVVELSDGEVLDAWTSDLVIPGATVWWTASTQPVRAVTAYGPDDEVIGSVTLDD